MKNSHVLELSDAINIVVASLEEANRNQLKISIAVCDSSGALLCLQRMDGAAPVTAEIAKEKAYCSAVTGKPSKTYEDLVNNGRFSALKMPFLPLEGAEPIIVDGQCIGAVGVSGAKSDQDVHIVRAGLACLKR